MRPDGCPSNFTQAWSVNAGLLVSNLIRVSGSSIVKYWPASKWTAVSPALPDGDAVTNVGGFVGFAGTPTKLLILSVTLVPDPSSNPNETREVAAEALVLRPIIA